MPTDPTPSPLLTPELHLQLADIIGQRGVQALQARAQHLAQSSSHAGLNPQQIFFNLTSSLIGATLAAQILHRLGSATHVM